MRWLAAPFLAVLVAGCATAAREPTPATASPPRPAELAAQGQPPVDVRPTAKPAAAKPTAAKQAAVKATVTPAAPGTPGLAARQPEPPATATTAAVKPAAPPTLDLKTLEEQLKATKAIGFMTKLSIRNQVGDLLDQLRDYYLGKGKPLADLRRSFDLLVMKLLALLQDEDAVLARSVATSREAIWTILADRTEFAKL